LAVQREANLIADEAEQPFAGGRCHGRFEHLHAKFLPRRLDATKQKTSRTGLGPGREFGLSWICD
jgi:hypothetical protein